MDLTLDQARRIVDAALERGRQSDLAPLAVAVLDAGGHLKLAGKSSEFLAALAAMSGGNVVPSPGGVLILSGDRLIGAVGVTGDTGSNDETCAVAGIEAVGLEPDTG